MSTSSRYSPPAGGLSWQARAACLEVDPDAMFPISAASETAALAVCARCPVIGRCLQFALATHQMFGVWGGQREADLRALARHQQAIARANHASTSDLAASTTPAASPTPSPGTIPAARGANQP